MIKKLQLLLVIIFMAWVLTACWKQNSVEVSWLPSLFSLFPSDFDQLLFIDVDDDIIDLLGTQYGEDTPVVQEFRWIESIWIRQASARDEGQNLLFVQWSNVDINQLAALGLIPLDWNYVTKSLGNNVQVYGEKDTIDSKDYNWVVWDKVIQEFWILYNEVKWNFSFVSRPTTEGLAWLAIQFSSKLLWTVWVLDLGNKLPSWEAKMLFSDWVVKSSPDDWNARKAWSNIPIHVSLHWVTDLLWVNTTMIKTFLPLLLSQYLGDWASLLTDKSLDTILTALQGAVSLDLVPSLLWMWWRLVLETPDVFNVFDTMYPVLDWAVKTNLFSWAQLESIREANILSRNTSLPVATGSVASIPLLSLEKWVDTTSISLMLIEDIPLIDETTSYPWSTLAIANIDFWMLTQMMGVEAWELLQDNESQSLQFEVITVEQENLIHIMME